MILKFHCHYHVDRGTKRKTCWPNSQIPLSTKEDRENNAINATGHTVWVNTLSKHIRNRISINLTFIGKPRHSLKIREIPPPAGRWTNVIPIDTVQSFPLVLKMWRLQCWWPNISSLSQSTFVNIITCPHTGKTRKWCNSLTLCQTANLRRPMVLF